MKPRKPETKEPSLRQKLAENLLRDFHSDYVAKGKAALEALREKSPEKYCELGARLIAAVEPKSEGVEAARTMEELGRALLRGVGCDEFAITEDMIRLAVAAQDKFVDELGRIAEEALQRENSGLN
jgi:hypothetical protein